MNENTTIKREELTKSNSPSETKTLKLNICEQDGKFGFSDEQGNVVIPFKWNEVGPFSEGLAAVKNDKGLWGYIDEQGEIVIPCMYLSATIFTNGLAGVLVQREPFEVIYEIDRDNDYIGSDFMNKSHINAIYRSKLLAKESKLKEAIQVLLPVAEESLLDSSPRKRLIIYYRADKQYDKFIEWCERTYNMFPTPQKESWPMIWLGDFYKDGESCEVDLLKAFQCYSEPIFDFGDEWAYEKRDNLLKEHPELKELPEVKRALEANIIDDEEEY